MTHRRATGLCFPTATREARERGGEIVHAIVTHPATGQRFWHAWVEREGRVHDDKQHKISVEKFYELFQPEDVRRYSYPEAAVYMLRARHHGPWEPDEARSRRKRS